MAKSAKFNDTDSSVNSEQESEKYKNLIMYLHFKRKKSIKHRVGDLVKGIII